MQEILISKQQDEKIIALIEEGKLKEVYKEKDKTSRIEGNIYIGKVKNILPGMQAGFIDIGMPNNAFIHIKDLLPKADNITGNKKENIEKYNINDYLKVNNNILVQVKKDSTALKGTKVSANIQIPGRFVVVLPNSDFITVSQKIENEEEKERLIKIARKTVNEKVGIIIRTAAKGKSEDIIRKDIKHTIDIWNKIKLESKSTNKNVVPRVLYKNNSIMGKILLDTVDNGIERICVDNKNVYEEVKKILNNIDENNTVKLELNETANLLDMYDVNDQIEKLNERKIWLKCGGFITIEKTEALTAIDVNSGKFTGKKNLEQTVLKVNKEASIEIARQLRLRDIGGIIIIDYINMQEDGSREEVLNALNSELKKDRSKTQVIEFTKLNLLEMTRKHMFSEE